MNLDLDLRGVLEVFVFSLVFKFLLVRNCCYCYIITFFYWI